MLPHYSIDYHHDTCAPQQPLLIMNLENDLRPGGFRNHELEIAFRQKLVEA